MPPTSRPFVSTHAPPVGRALILTVAFGFLLLASAGEVEAQTNDRHGNTFATATPLALGSSVSGHLHDAEDWDVFRIDLSAATDTTDIWAYVTGDEEVDTVAGLYDSEENLLAFNDDAFIRDQIRASGLRKTVQPGIYFIVLVSYRGKPTSYTLHVRAVVDPGDDTETALPLVRDTLTGGTIDGPGDANYFRLDFTERTYMIIDVQSLDLSPLEGVLLDSEGEEISANMYGRILSGSGLWFPIGFSIFDEFDPGTYYLRVTSPFDMTFFDFVDVDEFEGPRPTPFYVYPLEDTEHANFIRGCESRSRAANNPKIEDPLFACQWHLNSSDDRDINVESVWADGYLGEGVNVAVVDDGMYHAHADLRDNVDVEKNHDYIEEGDIYFPFAHHGTHVAGMIAARDNDVGVRGVAPRATIYGYNLIAGDLTYFDLLDAMSRNADVTAVSNNSWGPSDGPSLFSPGAFWERTIDAGVTYGYGGKGTFYVFAAGNGHLLGDDSNFDGLANYYATTAACAVDSRDGKAGYSEMGANLWVCAPANDRPGTLGESAGILTTENSDQYISDFAGTSAAAPIVSGVAALTRSANPDLTWRDIKLILAATARKNDPGSSGWEDGATKYGAGSPGDRYNFNHAYGFGVVDAGAAVELAKEWTNIPAMDTATAESGELTLEVPDATGVAEPASVTTALTLETTIGFTEFVEVRISLEHDSFRDLEIVLESPSGAESRLAVPLDTSVDPVFFIEYVPLYGEYRFGSAKHLGEDPNGEWKLRITDHYAIADGLLDSWSITVYGHEQKAGPPMLDSAEGVGRSLAVTWSEPVQKAGLPVTGYDLRHIRTEDDETVEENWTLVENVWTTATGGALAYSLDGLSLRERHDVQVRATNDWGKGEWSAVAVGTPGNAKPVFTDGTETGRSVPENTRALRNVGSAVAATDADGDTLTYTLGGPDAAYFDINANNGQILVGAGTSLDYETQTSYTVTVTATDIFDVTDTITVTISVTNVDLPGRGNEYDADTNERIDRVEAVSAVRDYFRGILTREELLQIIRLYFR